MQRLFPLLLLILAILCAMQSCKKQQAIENGGSALDSMLIINEILAHRAEVDSFFSHDPDSPFNRDTSHHYEEIKWFAPDIRFVFQSLLYRYDRPEKVIVLGTKGEERSLLKYGYFVLPFEGNNHRLNVYKSPGENHLLSVWFTDETTGKETYEVGRYLNISDEYPESSHRYSINLNNAYNPYCAYSEIYSCAIPRREDHLPFHVRAGEMKYHH